MNLITYSWSFNNRHTVRYHEKHTLLKATEKRLLVKLRLEKMQQNSQYTNFSKSTLFFHYITNLTGLDFDSLLQADNYKL